MMIKINDEKIEDTTIKRDIYYINSIDATPFSKILAKVIEKHGEGQIIIKLSNCKSDYISSICVVTTRKWVTYFILDDIETDKSRDSSGAKIRRRLHDRTMIE